MQPRLDYWSAAPELMRAVLALNTEIDASGLERSLTHLVKLRASQINGCAYCVNMHTYEARKDGETEQRLYLVSAWRDSPLYSDRERAAFAWTEALTQIAGQPVEDAQYAKLSAHFSGEEVVKLTALIAMINTWNRFSIAFRAVHEVNAAAAA